jgi:preprotein translocase subunit SecE
MNRESRRHRAREERRTEQAETTTVSREPDAPRERTSPGQFLREVRSELKKVNWPNRHEVVNYTVVVLVTTAVLTLFTWGLDWIISNAVINTLS